MVTGSRGQLALSLLEAGGQRGVHVVAAGRPDCDLVDPAAVANTIARFAPSVVVNAAAYTAVDKAEAEPALAHIVNAQGAGHVAVVCEKLGIPLVHISTDYVFNGLKGAPYDETDPTSPPCVYGRTKLEGERFVSAACQRHIIVRTAWVYSPFGHNFLKTMLKLAQAKPEVGVVEDQIGNPTYAPHLAEAVLGIAERIGSGVGSGHWGIYHIAGHGSATWRRFAEEIFRNARAVGGPFASVRPIASAAYPTAAVRPVDSRLDCSRLENVFGLALPPWQTGVRDCVTRLVATRPSPGGLLGIEQ